MRLFRQSYIFTIILLQSFSFGLYADNSNWKLLVGTSGSEMFTGCAGVGSSGSNPADSITGKLASTMVMSTEANASGQSISTRSGVTNSLSNLSSSGNGQLGSIALNKKLHSKTREIYQNSIDGLSDSHTLSSTAEIQAKTMALAIDDASNECQKKIYVDAKLLHNNIKKMASEQKAEGAGNAVASFSGDAVDSALNDISVNSSYDSVTNGIDSIASIVGSGGGPKFYSDGSITIPSITEAKLSCEKALNSAYTIFNLKMITLGDDTTSQISRKMETISKAVGIIKTGCKTMVDYAIPAAPQISDKCTGWLEKAINSYQACKRGNPLEPVSEDNEDSEEGDSQGKQAGKALSKAYVATTNGMSNYLKKYKSNPLYRALVYENLTNITEGQIAVQSKALNTLKREGDSVGSTGIYNFLKIKTFSILTSIFQLVDSAYAAFSKVGQQIFNHDAKVPCFISRGDGSCGVVSGKYDQFNELYETDARMAKVNMLVGELADSIQGQSRFTPETVEIMSKIRAEKEFIRQRREFISKEFYSHFYKGKLSQKELQRQQFDKFKIGGLQAILSGGQSVIFNSSYEKKDGTRQHTQKKHLSLYNDGNSKSPAGIDKNIEVNNDEYDIDVIYKKSQLSLFRIISTRYLKKRELWKK